MSWYLQDIFLSVAIHHLKKSTTHGLSKLRPIAYLKYSFIKKKKIRILSYLPSRSQVTHFPMWYVILFLVTAGVLRCWQADEPEKNMAGCSPAVILICVCVCVSYFWCLLVWMDQGVGPWLCSWYSSFPGEGPGTWWAPSKCLLTEGLLRHISRKLMKRTECG